MIIMVQEKCLDPQMKVKIVLQGKMRTEMKKNVPLTIRIPTSANYPIKAYQSVQGSNIQSVRSKPRQAHVPWPSSHTLYIDMYPPFLSMGREPSIRGFALFPLGIRASFRSS